MPNERQWAEALAVRLEPLIQARGAGYGTVHVSTEDLIRHSAAVMGYTPDQTPLWSKTDVEFTTDMLVWEDLDTPEGQGWLPRLVVEVKFFAVSGHDVLAFAAKAGRHRQVFPYLRTALLMPGMASIPPRLPLLGEGFDLMASWPKLEPDEAQLEQFAALLAEEVDCSRRLQALMADKGKSSGYTVVRRGFTVD